MLANDNISRKKIKFLQINARNFRNIFENNLIIDDG